MDADITAPFLESPATAGLFFDFDGTLSDLVDRPSDARPVAGAKGALTALGQRFRLVAIVSGRGAGELLSWLGDGIEIWGVHGAERTSEGAVILSERAEPYRELIARVRQDAARRVQDLDLPGVIVEDKGVMFVLHYRAATDQAGAAAALEGLARELAEGYGITASAHKMAIEFRPPVEFSKSQVLLQRSREAGLKAAAFVGDDVVDLPGFDALDQLAKEGLSTLRVAVASDDAPSELLERADLRLEGTAGVVRWMESLASGAPHPG